MANTPVISARKMLQLRSTVEPETYDTIKALNDFLSRFGTKTFRAALEGNGWGISENADGEYTLTIDNIRIRGSLIARELLFQTVRATNGSLVVSTTGKIRNWRRGRQEIANAEPIE